DADTPAYRPHRGDLWGETSSVRNHRLASPSPARRDHERWPRTSRTLGAAAMTSKHQRIQQIATDVTRDLMDKGKLIEAGFAAFRSIVIPKDAPDIQVREMRLAFLAGAEHVFSSMLTGLDPDAEPTDADLRRMQLIQDEIDEIRATLSERVHPAQG